MNPDALLDLTGFEFASEDARAVLLEWCRVVKTSPETQRHPLLVIVGPSCAGKTELAKRVLRHVGAADFSTMDPTDPRGFEKLAAANARGALLALCFEPKLKKRAEFSMALCKWLDCGFFFWRPLRSKAEKVQEIRTVMVATTHRVMMSADLARRSVFVQLKQRKEGA